MDNTQSSAARPGVVSLFFDSSLTVREVSQPQKAKIEPDSPAMNAERVRPAGLNQDQLKASPTSEAPDLAIAKTAKSTSMTSWKITSTICTCSVVSMPR